MWERTMVRRRELLGAGAMLLVALPARAATIDYTVPGIIPPIQQPNDMACWATVATMMMSWKKNLSLPIERAMSAAGPRYRQLFDNAQGLDGSEKPAFLTAMGLSAEVPQNYTIEGWAKLLRAKGPLWVTTNEGADHDFAIHARIIVGMKGDFTATGTSFAIVDPATGSRITESVQTFIQKFESVARIDLGDTGDLRPQVVHY